MKADEVRNILLASGADLPGHWRLPSGRHTPRLFLCNATLQTPALVEQLAAALVERVRNLEPAAVLTASLSAAVLGYAVARSLNIPFFIPTENDPPKMVPGTRVLIVEDAADTGTTLTDARTWVLVNGGVPVGVAVLVNRGSQGVAALGLPVIALVEETIPSWQPAECPLCAQGIPWKGLDPNRRGTE